MWFCTDLTNYEPYIENKVINEFEIRRHIQNVLDESSFVGLGYWSTLISGRGGTLLVSSSFT